MGGTPWIDAPKFPVFRAKVKGKTWEAHQEKALGSETQFRFVKWKWWVPALRVLKMMPDRYWRSSNPKKNACFFFSQINFLFFSKGNWLSWMGNMLCLCNFCFRYCDASTTCDLPTAAHPGLHLCSPVANRAKARPFLVEEKTLAKSPRKGWFKKGSQFVSLSSFLEASLVLVFYIILS